MNKAGNRSVTIVQEGRSGKVIYRESGHELSFHWEFGGGEVAAIVQAGTAEGWKANHPWAVGRRSEILRFVAAETARQKAPGARVEIDDRSGDIVLNQVSPAREAPIPTDVAWYYRLRGLRQKFAFGVLAVAVVFAGLGLLRNTLGMIDPGKGTPVGESVRTDTHIATLIQQLEPYTPSPARDHGKDRYTISAFIVPLDGSEPKLVPIAKGLAPTQFTLEKILGSDGQLLWVDVSGVSTVDLSNAEVRAASVPAPRDLQGAKALPFAIDPVTYLSAGFLTAPDAWFGLHSDTELHGEFAPGKFVKHIVPAQAAKEMRRLHRASLEGESTGNYFRILTMSPINDTGYLNAAFLRLDEKSEPLRLSEPDGALMLYTSEPGLKGTAVVARVDLQGAIVWKFDTGIDRFNLSQILPGRDSMAFVGTRPRQEGKVPEPLLVVVDSATGAARIHSLWQ